MYNPKRDLLIRRLVEAAKKSASVYDKSEYTGSITKLNRLLKSLSSDEQEEFFERLLKDLGFKTSAAAKVKRKMKSGKVSLEKDEEEDLKMEQFTRSPRNR